MMKLIKETIAPLYTRMRYFSRAQYNGLALFKTIWFNLRALPWRQARKLPIFIYKRDESVSLRDFQDYGGTRGVRHDTDWQTGV